MISTEYNFSVPQHIIYLGGYLDAVGRLLTTDSELFALSIRDAKDVLASSESIVGMPRKPIERWAEEFGIFVSAFLGLDQCSRLGFYLIDYICWFKEFTQSAECFKVESNLQNAGLLGRAVYLFNLDAGQTVLLWAERIDKAARDIEEAGTPQSLV